MICDNCIHKAVCDKRYFVNHCSDKHTEADIINPELEKIKAEFEEDKYILLNQITAIKVIDRRISELKGEQK